MSKKQINVFPDYLSTGLWDPDSGANLDPDDLDIPKGHQLALTYWHEMWEFGMTGADKKMSERYYQRWVRDGKLLCDLLTAENDKYEFVFKQNTYDV